ncbi:MAG: hypothetical protein IKP05_02135 [Alphaproteobacteria bacterium]|nr:hypothetical protein [Alphaproteobacteria bacterium]
MYKVSYTGDGQTTEFIFSFPFFQVADVHVAIDDQPVDSGCSIIPNDNFTGGRVIFSDAPVENTQIDIFRQISLSRIIDYQPTDKIDPEDLNDDFNFLLAAFQDLRAVDVDLSAWRNTHDNVVNFLNYTLGIVEDKLSGGGVLGIYNNLLSVLSSALPELINDYGSITEPAPTENRDDYGVL